MTIAVAIFSKTVGLSAVKTRLAAAIGKQAAEEFYRLSVSCVQETIAMAVEQFPKRIIPYWALAEEEGPNHPDWKGFNTLWTGNGDLGTRLASVSEELFTDHEGVIMMGTDSPQLNWRRILEAVSAMIENPDACIVGPAKDGGFYLFGSLRPLSRNIWEAVGYSRETTLNELIAELKAVDREVRYLPHEQDVDLVHDLVLLGRTLSAPGPEINKSQARLLCWLHDNQTLF